MVTTYTGIIWVHFGNHCDLYKALCQVRKVMVSEHVATNKHTYTPLICRMWTWALVEEAIYFFSLGTTPAQLNVATPKYPECVLRDEISNIHRGIPPMRPNFPRPWTKDKPMKAPLQTSNLFGGLGFMGLPTGTNALPAPPSTPNPFAYAALVKSQQDMQNGLKALQRQLTDGKRGGGGGGGFRNDGGDTGGDRAADLSHVHPIFAAAFKELHAKHNGRVYVAELLELAGKTVKDLPRHPTIDGPGAGTSRVCFPHIAGVCVHANCYRKAYGHPRQDQISDDYANAVVAVLQPGIDRMVNGERGSGGGRGNFSSRHKRARR